MSQLKIFLFGAPRLVLNDLPLEFDTRKAVGLMAYLALARTSLSRDTLAALFWPEYGQSQARANLRRTLSALAKGIGKSFLDVDRETIGLASDNGLWVDVVEYDRLLARARAHQHPAGEVCAECLPLLTRAADLVQGEFMAGFSLRDSPEFEEWQFFQSENLRHQFIGVLEKMVCAHSGNGDRDIAISYARRLVALDPLNEAAHGWLIQLYAEAGQRSAARRQYQQAVRVLKEELGISPGKEIQDAYQAIQDNRAGLRPVAAGQLETGDHPLALPLLPSVPLNNLPAFATPFVGRASEVSGLNALLTDPDCRLLTLVGLGGAGKTRLAVEVAAGQRSVFAGGVGFVSMAPVNSAVLIASMLADALAVSLYGPNEPRHQLLNYLREKQLLLVLDGFEHLLNPPGAEITLLTDILHHAPGIKLLVTSTQRLHLQGEWVFEIQGLPVPPDNFSSGIESYSAVSLFLQSAGRVDSNFKLTVADQPAIARICRLVDGLPLGIKLAAAWVHVLSCAEIAAEIESSLDFLTVADPDLAPRHRSLRAAFEHAWTLLSAEERRAFGQLSIFRDGFTRNAAQQVTGIDLTTLSGLVDKSLLYRTEPGRYDLHQVVRQYTEAHLQQAPESLAVIRQQHSRYYLLLLTGSEAQIKSSQQQSAITALSAEINNLRLAWQWAAAHGQVDALMQSFPTLLVFFEVRSWFQEGVNFFSQAVQALTAAQSLNGAVPLMDDTQLLHICLAEMKIGLGFFLFRRGQTIQNSESTRVGSTPDQAFSRLNDSLAFLETTGVQTALAYAHLCLGIVSYIRGDLQSARCTLQDGLGISRTLGDRWLVAVQLGHLGMIAYNQHNDAEAERILRESVALWREIGDIRGLVFNLTIFAMVAARQTAFEHAQQLLNESLLISSQHDDRWGIANTFNCLGQIALERQPPHLAEADYFLNESCTIFADLGARWMMVPVLNNLGRVACEQGNYDESQRIYLEALDIAITDHLLPAAMDALVGLAEVLVLVGEGASDVVPEIISQVLQHPASGQHAKDRASKLWACQQATGLLARAIPAGARSLDELVTELLVTSPTR